MIVINFKNHQYQFLKNKNEEGWNTSKSFINKRSIQIDLIKFLEMKLIKENSSINDKENI